MVGAGALAAVCYSASPTDAAVIGGVTRQIVRDWAVKFNAHVRAACALGRLGRIDARPLLLLAGTRRQP